MFKQHHWIIACRDCNILLNIKEDRCQNLIDHEGKIIPRSGEALGEFVDTANIIQIHFPLIEQIKEFIDQHKDHHLKSGPLIDEEFKEFKIINQNNPQNKDLEFSCITCNKKHNIQINQDQQIENKEFSVKTLEQFYTLLELYSALGMRINNHQHALALEQSLPFLKTHCNHKMTYKTG